MKTKKYKVYLTLVPENIVEVEVQASNKHEAQFLARSEAVLHISEAEANPRWKVVSRLTRVIKENG